MARQFSTANLAIPSSLALRRMEQKVELMGRRIDQFESRIEALSAKLNLLEGKALTELATETVKTVNEGVDALSGSLGSTPWQPDYVVTSPGGMTRADLDEATEVFEEPDEHESETDADRAALEGDRVTPPEPVSGGRYTVRYEGYGWYAIVDPGGDDIVGRKMRLPEAEAMCREFNGHGDAV